LSPSGSQGPAAALARLLGEQPVELRPVAGGDMDDPFRVVLASGRRLFVKTRAGAAAAEYEAQAAGLEWLGEGGHVEVPGVVAVGGEDPALLVLEWIEPGTLSPAGAERLGRGLARMHALGAPAHGFLPGGATVQRLGSLELPSGRGGEWAGFYAERRLAPLARLASERSALDAQGRAAVEEVCERISLLAGPEEPPARLHGDLWGGNVLAGADGRARLIDPAAQGGHRELDLAMLRLFGSPSERVFSAYEEVAPLAPGHEERVALWQLQPLLVHAVLFGAGYGAAAARCAASLL
jgi:fructosamine-3-kinase